MRDLFRLNTIPPLVDTFKVSLLETTLIENVRDKVGWDERDWHRNGKYLAKSFLQHLKMS